MKKTRTSETRSTTTVFHLPVVIEKDEDGYFVYCPRLQGCYSQGDTYEQAIENIKDAIRLHLEDRIANKEPLPEVELFSLTSVKVTV
jgi:predicted RNase H-like HicB family nuclease